MFTEVKQRECIRFAAWCLFMPQSEASAASQACPESLDPFHKTALSPNSSELQLESKNLSLMNKSINIA
jgi:hypothetical protein